MRLKSLKLSSFLVLYYISETLRLDADDFQNFNFIFIQVTRRLHAGRIGRSVWTETAIAGLLFLMRFIKFYSTVLGNAIQLCVPCTVPFPAFVCYSITAYLDFSDLRY